MLEIIKLLLSETSKNFYGKNHMAVYKQPRTKMNAMINEKNFGAMT
jgi:hypothetical protein